MSFATGGYDTQAKWTHEFSRRLGVLEAVHGKWVRAYMSGKKNMMPHCECSRCGLPSPPTRLRLASEKV
jgi:hypothetical protein